MKNICLLFLALWCVQNVTAQSTTPAKKYQINLDLPAEERWAQVAMDHKEGIKNLLTEIQQLVPQNIIDLFLDMKLAVSEFLPYPYGVELAGIASKTNQSQTMLLLANMVYELTAYKHKSERSAPKACTSIVASTADGSIIHARNFDYSLSPALRDLVIQVDFIDSGHVIYSGTTFAGLVGLPSAQKPNAFTISVNERNSGEFFENIFESILTGTHGIAHLVVRDTVANPTYDFKMAVEKLDSTPLIATIYAIIGGLSGNEGVVVTRGRANAINKWWLGSNNSWFLVETNYDHWTSPPAQDDRRDVAIKGMVETGLKQISMDVITNVLSIPPVLNDGTIFTNVMSASQPDKYKSWVRTPKN